MSEPEARPVSVCEALRIMRAIREPVLSPAERLELEIAATQIHNLERENAALREALTECTDFIAQVRPALWSRQHDSADILRRGLDALKPQSSQGHGEEIIDAQHDETGRMWQGKRKDLPPRFREVTMEGDSKCR